MALKRLLFVLSVFFVLLTFVGAGYVLLNNGEVNAGFAVIPMVFALASITLWRNNKAEKK